MYAVDDQRSLDRLYDEAENACKFIEPDSFVWAVVGNKDDLRSDVEESTARALANQIGANPKLVLRTSAKTGHNVTSSMDTLVKSLHRKVTRSGHVQSESVSRDEAIQLPDATTEAASPNVTSASNKSPTSCC